MPQLKKRPSNRKERASSTRGEPVSTPTPGPTPSMNPRKLWMFRAMALVGLPLALLLGTELALRLSGYGYDPSFFRKERVNGKECWVQNDRFGLSFFPPRLARYPGPILMEEPKPPGTVRIFILGESAAMGDPAPKYGAGRYLEALLRERYPAERFEIVNTALTAINSHAILPIARECAERDGDIWIIYMGNNEMIGPYGAATVFGRKAPSLGFVRVSLALQGTRMGQALVALGRRMKGDAAQGAAWAGMQMFLNNTVAPGDASREVVYRSYAKNLEDMLAVAGRARVVLSTVGVNLRDCSPFASLSGGLGEAELASLQAQLTNGAPAEQLTACESLLRTAVDSAPKSAQLRFFLGRCLLLRGQDEAARTEFGLALEYDALPFRADRRINEAVKTVAQAFQDRGVVLANAAAALEAAAPAGAPGEESFYEHVHLNFDGNYRLARVWAEQMAGLLPETLRNGGAADWADQAQCERRIGLTDWNRKWVYEEVLRRYGQAPLSAQATREEQVGKLSARLATLTEKLKTADREAGRQVYVEALRQWPGDYRLYENYADFLEAIGDNAGALEQRKIVCDLLPHYYFAHFSLGTLLKEQRQFGPAQFSLERAAQINPTQPDIRLHLGSVYALQKQWDKALAQFELGQRLDPQEARFLHMQGDVLWRMDRRQESLYALRAAVAMAPEYLEARYRLAEALGISGDFAGAVAELQKVLEQQPGHERARLNYGVGLMRLGRAREAVQQFDLVLTANSGNKLARELREQALAESGRAR